MDQLGLKRYCCRRMIMTHVDLIEKLLKYVATDRDPRSQTAQLACFVVEAYRPMHSCSLTRNMKVHSRRPQREEEPAAPGEPMKAPNNGPKKKCFRLVAWRYGLRAFLCSRSWHWHEAYLMTQPGGLSTDIGMFEALLRHQAWSHALETHQKGQTHPKSMMSIDELCKLSMASGCLLTRVDRRKHLWRLVILRFEVATRRAPPTQISIDI